MKRSKTVIITPKCPICGGRAICENCGKVMKLMLSQERYCKREAGR